ncbi:MAG: DUF6754 domain-containing protein [Chloroflexota bacterium]
MSLVSLLGIISILGFVVLMFFFAAVGRKSRKRYLRDIPAFAKLRRGIGLAVEAGQRLHVSLGHGGVNGLEGASALVGLSMLQRIARAASISDRPPTATSGEATLAVLSQDTLRSVYQSIGAEEQYEPTQGQLSGLTPFSFAAGAIPVVYDQQVSVNILAGHFGSEVALITDAAERKGALTLAGSDSISAQAVLYATAEDTLIGEELYAGGAYVQAGPMHLASVRTQDVVRWVIVILILAGAALKLVGVL